MESLDAFRRFSLSVDIINDSVKKEINNILENICSNVLGADFFEVQIKGLPNKMGEYESLKTIWSNEKGTSTTIKKDGKYTGHTSYAFDKRKKLWITTTDGSPLKNSSQCIDQWSQTNDLPPYWDYEENSESQFRTSVILPLQYEGVYTPIGILNLEFDKKYECSRKNKRIFENLAKSIAILTHSYEVRSHQTNNTESALRELRKLSTRKLMALDKPTIFVAFPTRCERDIISLIEEISKEFSTDYDFIFWDKINSSGSIDEHLINAITKSKYGIIYFSQKDEGNQYIDNPNVVFEAGMFHAMTSDNLSKEPVRWIPIREKNSGPKPFDFAHQRIIEIHRDSENKIKDLENIKKMLKGRLNEF